MANPSDNTRPEPDYLSPVSFWEPEQLLAYGFGKYTFDDKSTGWEVGMVFQSPDYGLKVFKGIAGWNYNEDKDPDNLIGLSFIIAKDDSYFAFVYPTLEDAKFAQGSPPAGGISNVKIVGAICKNFEGYKNSHLKNFRDAYKSGNFAFTAYYFTGGTIKPIPGVKSILKKDVKIKRREDLTPEDYEWHHFTRIIEA